ncbi:hypothetical protein F8388_023192 [Cannabis sativa]|uniref:Uncharacterized protein n=1 Tax=Cannabis sativa TaxID=3483 RepID=A0A7J6HFB6_CANSA|nr:hypothetical protein F8388_023192 [Cannabis sativa]
MAEVADVDRAIKESNHRACTQQHPSKLLFDLLPNSIAHELENDHLVNGSESNSPILLTPKGQEEVEAFLKCYKSINETMRASISSFSASASSSSSSSSSFSSSCSASGQITKLHKLDLSAKPRHANLIIKRTIMRFSSASYLLFSFLLKQSDVTT